MIHTEYVAHLKKIIHPEEQAPFEMRPLSLYSDPSSPSCRAVKVFLDIMQHPYSLHEISLAKKEHKSESFININPQGKLPTLLFGDVPLNESSSIL